MKFMQAFKMAINAIMANKMRSFLTMLGIIIGVFSVTALITVGARGDT
jgi:putative ABC transport system permease protein